MTLCLKLDTNDIGLHVMNFKDLENLMRDVVSNFPELRLSYLFGSQVTGKTGPLSDYDLAGYW